MPKYTISFNIFHISIKMSYIIKNKIMRFQTIANLLKLLVEDAVLYKR